MAATSSSSRTGPRPSVVNQVKKLVKRTLTGLGIKGRPEKPRSVLHFAELKRIRDDISSQPETVAGRFLNFLDRRFKDSTAQLFQDIFVDFVLQKTGGTFCEFGATDGISLSNTHYLENHRGWSGLLAEPARQWHGPLKANRPSLIIDTRCVYSRSGERIEFLEARSGEYSTIQGYGHDDAHGPKREDGQTYEVETVSLNDLLTAHGVVSLDYLSVDTEGSELEILSSFDFGQIRPRVLTVEHNFTDARQAIHQLMRANGYHRMFEQFSDWDDWYVTEECRNHVFQREGLSDGPPEQPAP
jgi:FkbM family methyltransferase